MASDRLVLVAGVPREPTALGISAALCFAQPMSAVCSGAVKDENQHPRRGSGWGNDRFLCWADLVAIARLGAMGGGDKQVLGS